MTWEAEPENGDYGYITMKCGLAFDSAGVEYLFTNTTRGTSSGWQPGRTWNEGGLEHGKLYTYRVKARDLSPSHNETGWSTNKSVATWSVEPGTLIITGFQCPVQTGNNPYFEGWYLNEPGSTYVNQSPGGGVPGGPTNRVLEFNQITATGTYDTDHEWSRRDVYTLSFNAAPNSWGGDQQRYAEVSLRQTDDTVLWSDSIAVPLYDPLFAGADPWPTQLTYTFSINANDFSAGTQGELLRLKLAHSGDCRSLYFDNIFLFEKPPVGTVLTIR